MKRLNQELCRKHQENRRSTSKGWAIKPTGGIKSVMMVVVLIVGFFIAGCGEKAPSVDTTPFEDSIATYLSSKSMDMKVSKFKDIKVDGDTATGTCSMIHKTVRSPAVQWGFTFTKSDGKWSVTNCKQ